MSCASTPSMYWIFVAMFACGPSRSELEAAGTRRVGQGLDATVEARGAAIEHDALDPRRLRLLRDLAADHRGALRLLLALERVEHRLRRRRRMRERATRRVVDD